MLHYNPQQYVCYITILNMRADCSAVCSHPAYCTAVYREWRYQMPW